MSKQPKCLCAFERVDPAALDSLQDDFFVMLENHKDLHPAAFTHYMYILLTRLSHVLNEGGDHERHLIRIFSMALDHVAAEFNVVPEKPIKKKGKKNAN